MSYFAIFKQVLTSVQTSSCKSLDFFEVTFFPYEPYLQKKNYAELILVSELMGSIDTCILCTLYISNQSVVLANSIYCNSCSKYDQYNGILLTGEPEKIRGKSHVDLVGNPARY